ncbi:MAG: LiaF transmembrane domain-containing protein [Cytophaga sp.]|uniref:LiaF transmembrane domain-containing protein n=1 Tax=Cytophaga sp. TaxID=29535 RepID=UPI003F819FAD
MAHSFSGKRIWAGTLLLLTGVFYLLYNFNALPFVVPSYVFSWQMAVILTGVYFLYKSFMKGLLIIAIGTYFILPLTGMMPPIDIEKMWPALLILLGVIVLFGSGFKKKNKKNTTSMKTSLNEDLFEITTIMGGDSRQLSSYDFKGGKITAIMGGVELDMTNCYLSKEGCIIDLSVVMGGISLKISREWNIKSEITPIMSGIEDEDQYSDNVHIDPAATIILRGSVVMGGIEIKRA